MQWVMASIPVAAVTDGELVGQGLELQNLIQPLEVRVERLREYLIECKLSEIIEVKGISRNAELLPIGKDVTFLMYEGPWDHFRSGYLLAPAGGREQEQNRNAKDPSRFRPSRWFHVFLLFSLFLHSEHSETV